MLFEISHISVTLIYLRAKLRGPPSFLYLKNTQTNQSKKETMDDKISKNSLQNLLPQPLNKNL